MTTLREAAQQALEALEAVYGDSCDAIHAIRAALAEPQEPVCDCCANCLRPKHEHRGDDCPKPYTTVWHAWDYTHHAPQRQPQEPAKCAAPLFCSGTDKCIYRGKPQPLQPVAHLWMHSETGRTRVVMPDQIITADAGWIVVGPLYLAPQRQPLTDEKIAEIALSTPIGGTNSARAIERAHGIGGQE